jgi:hypothetical protein
MRVNISNSTGGIDRWRGDVFSRSRHGKVVRSALRLLVGQLLEFLMQKRRPLLVSVMIVTRNRLADLQRTCRVLKNLDPASDDILITADRGADGTVRVR